MKPSPGDGGPSSLGILEVEVLIRGLFKGVAPIWIPPSTIPPAAASKAFCFTGWPCAKVAPTLAPPMIEELRPNWGIICLT